MKSTCSSPWFVPLLLAVTSITLACGGDERASTDDSPKPETAAGVTSDRITGQGEYRFRVLHRNGLLPKLARRMLGGVHAGFAVDRRPGRGEFYFAIKGAGIVRLSSDLSTATMIPTDPAMLRNTMHNTGLMVAPGGEGRLLFASTDTGQIFTTDTDGRVLDTLNAPESNFPFTDPRTADYFARSEPFKPTDVEVLDESLYIPTGYSNLDAVLMARIRSHVPMQTEWTPSSFGGRGDAPEQFRTGHGITLEPDGRTLAVTDRLHSEIDRFAPDGSYLGSIAFPKHSQPCDIDFFEDLAVVASLVDPEKGKGAPIYLLKDREIVSTLRPKDELDLEKFTHVHDAALHRVGDRLVILALAWMPGDFVVMEQVLD